MTRSRLLAAFLLLLTVLAVDAAAQHRSYAGASAGPGDPPEPEHEIQRASRAVHDDVYDAAWASDESALLRRLPAVRYNRVEGFVLGLGVPPLAWEDYDRAGAYGQIGYAFALDRVRYTAGLEVRPGPEGPRDFALKLGGNVHRNTTANDLWQSNWHENSLAAFFVGEDHFDYYEIQGYALYGVQQITPYAQVGIGWRSDEHRSLGRNTSWSLFREHTRPNLVATEGLARSVVLAVEGGRVAGEAADRRGLALRTEAELGQGLGGDFDFSRLAGEVTAFLPLRPHHALHLRTRAGVATGDRLPVQKLFAVGGLGTVRAYPTNAFLGSHLLLVNASYQLSGLSLLDELVEELLLYGFADAAWVDGGGFTLAHDALVPAAGLGAGLGEAGIRLELAWPLRDLGTGLAPALWFRLNPEF